MVEGRAPSVFPPSTIRSTSLPRVFSTSLAQEQLEEISKNLVKVANGQDKINTEQNSNIANVQKRVGYVEQELVRLDRIQADVEGLKVDTGNLKGEYVSLKQDLEKVRVRGVTTEGELIQLTDRSRRFQLKVLAARAREAAEAAKKADLKKLLARLTE